MFGLLVVLLRRNDGVGSSAWPTAAINARSNGYYARERVKRP
jgi:hypothetical protein